MSKAKDFDSNFVSGAYEVNKERDRRRTRRMQKIKYKKEAEKLAKAHWDGNYIWISKKRVGAGSHMVTIQPERKVQDYKKVYTYEKGLDAVVVRLVPNGFHIEPAEEVKVKDYEYVPVDKPYALKFYTKPGKKKLWKRLGNKRVRQSVRRYVDNECYVYDELTLGVQLYLDSVDWYSMKK